MAGVVLSRLRPALVILGLVHRLKGFLHFPHDTVTVALVCGSVDGLAHRDSRGHIRRLLEQGVPLGAGLVRFVAEAVNAVLLTLFVVVQKITLSA